MALPKLGVPTHELTLPSNGKNIKYRPFLVKEEKLLLLALESEDEKEVINAVKNLLKNCVLSRIKIDQLPSFDLEYLFLRIRAAAVGSTVELTVTCVDDGKTTAKTNINLNEIEISKSEDHTNKIMLTEDTGIIMKYPSMDRFIESQFLDQDLKTDEIFNFIADHIDSIFQGEEVYDRTTTTKKEFREFVEGLTSKQFEEIQKFYETMPKLSHTFKVVNPNTQVESEYTVEGLQSFFA